MVPFEGNHLEGLICARFFLSSPRPSQASQCQHQQRLPAWSQSPVPHRGCSALGANAHTVVSPAAFSAAALCAIWELARVRSPGPAGWPLIPLPPPAPGRGFPAPAAHTPNSSALEALPPALLTPTELVEPLPGSQGSPGAADS